MITATDTEYELTPSDNSHIFGMPFVIQEGYDAFGISIDRKDLRSWIEKTEFLEDAGIEVHLDFKEKE